MTYVPGAANDVFISYARIDNETHKIDDGWVDQFRFDLTCALKARIGLRTGESIKVFFDERDLGSNESLSALQENARKSAVFVAIVSPSYVNREWTRKELAAFMENGDLAGRLFAIENLPVESKSYSDLFGELACKKFWEQPEKANGPIPIGRDDRVWKLRVNGVANEIKNVLHRLKDCGGINSIQKVGASLFVQAPIDPKRTVLLAQVTDDLDKECEQVRSFLEQYDIAVLPSGAYPQGGEEFKRAFASDLAKSNYFVQLLGPLRSRRDPKLPEGYARYQYTAAQEESRRRNANDLVRLLWRRPGSESDLDLVEHDDAELLSKPELQGGMTLQQLMEGVKRKVEDASIVPVATLEEPEVTDSGVNVFINCDQADEQLAEELQRDFIRNGCTTVRTIYNGNAGKIRRSVANNIRWCHTLALVYGQAEPDWIAAQGMAYQKIKSQIKGPQERPRLIVILRGPPQPKRAHGFGMPGLREVDYESGSQVNSIKALVAELKR